MKSSFKRTVLAGAFLFSSVPAHAVLIGGVEFPQGAASFADVVVSYSVGGGGVTAEHMVPANALGTPNHAGVNDCTGGPCSFVSLGNGGSIVLRFVDNALTGSGTSAADLWIFEVGPAVEDTFVEISKDGITFFSVGAVAGSTAGVDIDAFGFGPSDLFLYVRLTDDPAADGGSGITQGADIDAVGAISTVLLPEPATLALLGLGLAGVAGFRRRIDRR